MHVNEKELLQKLIENLKYFNVNQALKKLCSLRFFFRLPEFAETEAENINYTRAG
jgi:hypothetical protein